MTTGSAGWWVRLVLVSLGLFGLAFAVTGLLTGLPRPAVGGTCGPGRGSEAAIVAFFDPVTIGAGQQPPTSDTAAHAQWQAFVQECQSAADDRIGATLAILVFSVGLIVAGGLMGRRSGRKKEAAPVPSSSMWAPPAPPRHPLDPPEIPYFR
jgi:hypothetical protein